MVCFSLYPEPPFDFQKITKRLKQNGDHTGSETLVRTMRHKGKACLAVVTSRGTVERPELHVTVISKEVSVDVDAISTDIRSMLATDVDVTPFYRHVRQLPQLKAMIEPLYGLRPVLQTDRFACLVNTVIGQQVNLTFARTLKQRLMDHVAKPIVYEGQHYRVFPSPAEVAALDETDLTQLQFSRRKAEYIIDLARQITNGDVRLDEWDEVDDQEVIRRLTRIRGIGRWSAECFLLFGLGRSDGLPAADVGLRNGVKAWFGLEEQPSEEQVRRIAQPWSPWSGYVTFYIWESLKNQQVV